MGSESGSLSPEELKLSLEYARETKTIAKMFAVTGGLVLGMAGFFAPKAGDKLLDAAFAGALFIMSGVAWHRSAQEHALALAGEQLQEMYAHLPPQETDAAPVPIAESSAPPL